MADDKEKKGIEGFLAAVSKQGGLAFSNTYEVDFSGFGTALQREMSAAGFNENTKGNSGSAMFNLQLMCEEASLPGMMANTGQTTGKFLGEGQVNYAHTKSFQDLTLGWTCDANLSPLKFLNAWMKAVFDESDSQPGRYTTTRLNYPDEYMCRKLTIKKAERNRQGTIVRGGGIYTFNEVWPYAIQSTPVSYGSSQLLKVTASFYYRNWKFDGVGFPRSQ